MSEPRCLWGVAWDDQCGEESQPHDPLCVTHRELSGKIAERDRKRLGRDTWAMVRSFYGGRSYESDHAVPVEPMPLLCGEFYADDRPLSREVIQEAKNKFASEWLRACDAAAVGPSPMREANDEEP